ncbi:hypothetical protein [Streptomyces sp. NPDC051219]|uniref:hypothetical protein n=1 Tax=Streptomyces sp. NPDC051219 TaxID=3155283 RepID=UPI0034275B6E
MSQSVPPTGNPFADGAVPPAPAPAPVRNNVALGLVAGLVAAIVGALAYGGIMRALADEDGSYSEIGFLALGVGALVGVALGKLGGRNPILPIAGVPLALLGVFLGQMFGYALMISWWSELAGTPLTLTELFTSELGNLFKAWKEEADFMSILFFAIAGYEGFAITKKLGG